MAYPLVRDADNNIAVLLRDLDIEQQNLVKRARELVCRFYDTSDSRLFGVYGYGQASEQTLGTRAALTLLFRQMRPLLLEVKWVASYLGRKKDEIELYELAAVTLLKDYPNGGFSKTFMLICKDLGIDVSELLS